MWNGWNGWERFGKVRLLRFTRNDRRKRCVVTMAIVRGSLKKGDCFRQGIRNDTSASLQSLCRHYKRYFVIARNGVVVRLFRSKLKGIAEIASLLSVARNDVIMLCSGGIVGVKPWFVIKSALMKWMRTILTMRDCFVPSSHSQWQCGRVGIAYHVFDLCG